MSAEAVNGLRQHRDTGPIAVLDDDDAFREALAAALVSLGYLVQEFCQPEALLEAIRLAVPACLIIDFHLPGMTGLEVQDVLVREGVSVPLIFLTACVDPPVAAKARSAGAFSFLNKPVRMEVLDALIRRAVGLDDAPAAS